MPKYSVRRHAVTQPLDQSYRFIPLTRGKNAIVDAEDFQWLSQWNWFALSTGEGFYAGRNPFDRNGKTILMHREILGLEPTETCDHINGERLDNRRVNLRKCTDSQNLMNARLRSGSKSGYKGVSWSVTLHKWEARIHSDGKTIHLGASNSPKRAAKIYDAAARKHFGSFARTNF